MSWYHMNLSHLICIALLFIYSLQSVIRLNNVILSAAIGKPPLLGAGSLDSCGFS